MARVEHMSVAEMKRQFADVVGKVLHGDVKIIVERRGKPILGLVPPDEVRESTGKRLAEVIGKGGKEGQEFADFMRQVVADRVNHMPREVHLPDV